MGHEDFISLLTHFSSSRSDSELRSSDLIIPRRRLVLTPITRLNGYAGFHHHLRKADPITCCVLLVADEVATRIGRRSDKLSDIFHCCVILNTPSKTAQQPSRTVRRIAPERYTYGMFMIYCARRRICPSPGAHFPPFFGGTPCRTRLCPVPFAPSLT
jgi:hypothetical protein